MKEMNENTEERRTEFIRAAEKLFRKKGIMNTTVSSIVREVNVAKGLFYYYFQSKDDVINALAREYSTHFEESIRDIPMDDYDRALDRFLHNVITSFLEMQVNLCGENDTIDLSILAGRTMEDAKETASVFLKDLLDEGHLRYKFNLRKSQYYARMIIGGIAELVQNSDADADEIYRLTADILNRLKKGE